MRRVARDAEHGAVRVVWAAAWGGGGSARERCSVESVRILVLSKAYYVKVGDVAHNEILVLNESSQSSALPAYTVTSRSVCVSSTKMTSVVLSTTVCRPTAAAAGARVARGATRGAGGGRARMSGVGPGFGASRSRSGGVGFAAGLAGGDGGGGLPVTRRERLGLADVARHVSDSHLNPRLSSSLASYDVARNMSPALRRGRQRHRVRAYVGASRPPLSPRPRDPRRPRLAPTLWCSAAAAARAPSAWSKRWPWVPR
jgi:hypothetical protein